MLLYELAEELGASPNDMRLWLKKRGLGGKGKLSAKAVSQARAQFKPPSETESVMSQVFVEPKSPQQLKAARAAAPQQRRRRSWGKAEPVGPSVSAMSTDEQRDLIKQLRGGVSAEGTAREVEGEGAPIQAERVTSQLSPSDEETSPVIEPDEGSREEPPAQERFSEVYYKKRYEELYAQYTAQRERLKKTDLSLKALKEEHEALKLQRPMEAERAPREPQVTLKEPALVWEELSSFSLSEGDAVNALLELIEHPVKGPELLYRLKLDEPSILLNGFRFYCGDELCYELANQHARLGLIHVEEEQRCVICAGHEGQRWYSYLLHVAQERGVKRLLLVGGEDANTTTLKSFERANPRLSWSFISGDGRDDQTSANSRVEGAQGVLLWGGMNLPHRLSNLYKSASDTMKVPCVTIPPGQRGVSAICKAALKMLGVDEEVLG